MARRANVAESMLLNLEEQFQNPGMVYRCDTCGCGKLFRRYKSLKIHKQWDHAY